MRESAEQEIIHKAVIRCNTHYYSCADAAQLVDICRQKGIPVLGIDAFVIDREKTQPCMEHSMDCSERVDAYDYAREFLLAKRNMGLMFEVVY